MDLFALTNAQTKVKTVRKQSDLRFEQYLQAQIQKQQSGAAEGNIFADAAAQKQTAPTIQQTASTDSNTKKEKQGFEAIA